jgi:hypothetical protein
MNKSSLPVLVIGYARHRTLIELIKTILENQPTKVYIALDGPTDDSVLEKQTVIVEEIDALSKETAIEIQLNHRRANLGSGAGVISAIDWFFSNEKAGIILEDDLEVDSFFFKYMNEVTPFLEKDASVLMASGTRFDETVDDTTSLCSYPIVWGWATNHEKWHVMRKLIFETSGTYGNHIRLSERFYWNTGKRRALKSQIDAWDVPLAAGMRKKEFFCLVPPFNLVTNIGFDSMATHTTEAIWPLGLHRHSNIFAPIIISNSHQKREENDLLMRKEIFRISTRHIFTSLVSLVWDPIRFRNRRKYSSMLARVQCIDEQS